MAKASIPTGLPDTPVLHALEKRIASLKTAPARKPAYLEWLKILRDRVAPELTYTNVTFPLFTPHDEQNHVHPLFVLTERLLGSEVVESLNATELFILACSLYAHDWGMAVSEAEKRCIIGLVEPKPSDSFTLLDDDRRVFAKLLKDNRIAEPKALSDVPLEVWQIHIRQTHAARSARRVRAFFSSIDANLGGAVALVSEGHSLDVERLRPFETALPLQGESANIRALALYLRLIDLFDLGHDRTPYALWNFVSPEIPKSAEEWNKHRALSPVVIEQFQETSRCLKVRGSTDDHRIYAALEDLREYCDGQLRLSNGLLNELEPRYQPHLLHLDWKVEPRGFEPITVRFEFERQAMINVLSDEIYQGDRCVFLRELLQNSIDAIRLRRALHQAKNTGVTFDGEIHVTVEHQPDGRATVTWRDNGCGMSAFIVRNYLTVAGRSFYRSEDFRKLGAQMDPISRFGVGILSCFMVGERLEVFTRQDPHLESSAEALKIEVHNPQRHLRIQRFLPDSLPAVGTTTKVFVGSFVPNDDRKSALAKLDVTEYLKEIAGFVEFPIYVDEDGRRTVILHPDQAGSVKKVAGWEVAALNRSFAWQDFFVPQDVQRARELFTEETICLRPTTKHTLFEGTISYPILNDDIELRRDFAGSRPGEESYVAIKGSTELGRIRVLQRWGSEKKLSEKSQSSACDNLCRIYCDGVLVPGVSVPGWVGGGWTQPTTFRIVLNIRRTAGTRLDLSRHDIVEGDHNWSDYVFQRCVDSFRKRAKQIITEKTPKESLYYLARLVAYRSSFRMNLVEVIGDSKVPVIVLTESGDIVVTSDAETDGGIFGVVPESLAESLSGKIFADWATSNWLQGRAPRIPWFGERCVFAQGMTFGLRSAEFCSLSAVEQLHKAWVDVSQVRTGIRFLSPGQKNTPPLIQEIWLPKKAAQHNARRRYEMTQSETQVKTYLAKLGSDYAYNAPEFVTFSAPFEEFFTAGWKYLNLLHPAVGTLAECVRAVADRQSARAIAAHDLGAIRDALEPLFRDRRFSWRDYLSDSAIDAKCEAIERLFHLTSNLQIFELPAELIWKKQTLNVPPMVKAGKFGVPIQSLDQVRLI